MNVIISIPAYNEEKSIGKVIEDINRVMSQEKHNYTILVVNDGSTDNTAKIARKLGAKVIDHPYNCGLAKTFQTEMKEALKLSPDIIVHTDADGQYLAQDIPSLIRPIEKKEADIVIGDRFGGKIERMSIMKKIGNKAFSRVISKIIKVKVNDCQSGFRSFIPEIAKIAITSNHTYTQEQIIKAVREKYIIKDVPIYFASRSGKSRLIKNPIEYAIKAWVNIFRIYRDFEPLKFFGKIGVSFILAGVAIGLWLVYNFITTGRVGHIPLTILTILLIMMGIQIVLFGFLADMRRE
jgi:glycosyltransferase involved in cell wall biosynthesis